MSHTCCDRGEHVNKLNQQVSVMRKEINNLRQSLDTAVRAHRKQMTALQSALSNVGQAGFQTSQSTSQTEGATPLALEQGRIQTVPIGNISSCFSVKNGTPRQPTVCGPSRATLQIRQDVFNNPDHSLVGLEQYSHVWVIFLFHKNGHLSYKAKVKPPRLNGQRVGVYSTRSPHRPNALGLTLAKLDRVSGDTLHLSEIDMIAGTPVLDIKPYIPDYDSPHSRMGADTEDRTEAADATTEGTTVNTGTGSAASSVVADSGSPSSSAVADSGSPTSSVVADSGSPTSSVVADSGGPTSSAVADSGSPTSSVVAGLDSAGRDAWQNRDARILLSKDKSKVHILSGDNVTIPSDPDKAQAPSSFPKDINTVLAGLKAYVTQGDATQSPGSSPGKSQASDGPKARLSASMEEGGGPCYGEEAYSTIAAWIREPPVASLDVRFTPHAEKELGEFLPPDAAEPPGRGRPRFRFLRSPGEAAEAIKAVLSADPRSVYRRTRCEDRLFFFTLDTADVTCWFGPGFAEVLRVRPVEPDRTRRS